MLGVFVKVLRIIEAKKEDRDIILNLLKKYLYEFSQWEKTDVNYKGLLILRIINIKFKRVWMWI